MSAIVEINPGNGMIEIEGKPFSPIIYDLKTDEEIPQGFNAVKVCLPANLESDLKWDSKLEQAKRYIDQGYYIFWELEMGLFSDLPLPLSDTTQYRSLLIALDHFFETCWKSFKYKTLGVSLFRGSIDFSKNFVRDIEQVINVRGWIEDRFLNTENFKKKTEIDLNDIYKLEMEQLKENEKGLNLLRLYSRDVALDYIDLLVSHFPDELQAFIFLDVKGVKSPTHLFQLLGKESIEYVNLAIRGADLYYPSLVWDRGKSIVGYIGGKKCDDCLLDALPKIGVMIPEEELFDPNDYMKLDKAIDLLKQYNMFFRPILERHLTMEWDGLDELIVLSPKVNKEAMRKLQGFCAANGKVIHLENPLHLESEESFQSFEKRQFNQ